MEDVTGIYEIPPGAKKVFYDPDDGSVSFLIAAEQVPDAKMGLEDVATELGSHASTSGDVLETSMQVAEERAVDLMEEEEPEDALPDIGPVGGEWLHLVFDRPSKLVNRLQEDYDATEKCLAYHLQFRYQLFSAWLQHAGFTHEDVALSLGYRHTDYISKLRRGVCNPNKQAVEKIAGWMEVRPVDLLRLKDEAVV